MNLAIPPLIPHAFMVRRGTTFTFTQKNKASLHFDGNSNNLNYFLHKQPHNCTPKKKGIIHLPSVEDGTTTR